MLVKVNLSTLILSKRKDFTFTSHSEFLLNRLILVYLVRFSGTYNIFFLSLQGFGFCGVNVVESPIGENALVLKC